jgi:hypothetical protein
VLKYWSSFSSHGTSAAPELHAGTIWLTNYRLLFVPENVIQQMKSEGLSRLRGWSLADDRKGAEPDRGVSRVGSLSADKHSGLPGLSAPPKLSKAQSERIAASRLMAEMESSAGTPLSLSLYIYIFVYIYAVCRQLTLSEMDCAGTGDGDEEDDGHDLPRRPSLPKRPPPPPPPPDHRPLSSGFGAAGKKASVSAGGGGGSAHLSSPPPNQRAPALSDQGASSSSSPPLKGSLDRPNTRAKDNLTWMQAGVEQVPLACVSTVKKLGATNRFSKADRELEIATKLVRSYKVAFESKMKARRRFMDKLDEVMVVNRNFSRFYNDCFDGPDHGWKILDWDREFGR